MAGSRAWFNYVSDNGITYAVELDEDTAAITGLGFTPYNDQAPSTTLPQGYKMRYINAAQVSGQGAGFVSRQIPVGIPTAPLFTGQVSSLSVNGISYAVSSSRGEKQRRPKQQNTGLIGNSSQVGGQTGA